MTTEELKDKYSAFIAEISEIMGLGKPIDILKLCATTDLFFRPLENRITDLEAQIEKMKCCENCIHHYIALDDTTSCKLLDRLASSKPCEKWEIKENA